MFSNGTPTTKKVFIRKPGGCADSVHEYDLEHSAAVGVALPESVAAVGKSACPFAAVVKPKTLINVLFLTSIQTNFGHLRSAKKNFWKL